MSITTERTKIMANKLYDQVQRDHIENEWAVEFIISCHNRIDAGLSLTEKQVTKLEELFERY
jgi:hypothetical protein